MKWVGVKIKDNKIERISIVGFDTKSTKQIIKAIFSSKKKYDKENI